MPLADMGSHAQREKKNRSVYRSFLHRIVSIGVRSREGACLGGGWNFSLRLRSHRHFGRHAIWFERLQCDLLQQNCSAFGVPLGNTHPKFCCDSARDSKMPMYEQSIKTPENQYRKSVLKYIGSFSRESHIFAVNIWKWNLVFDWLLWSILHFLESLILDLYSSILDFTEWAHILNTFQPNTKEIVHSPVQQFY